MCLFIGRIGAFRPRIEGFTPRIDTLPGTIEEFAPKSQTFPLGMKGLPPRIKTLTLAADDLTDDTTSLRFRMGGLTISVSYFMPPSPAGRAVVQP